MRRGFLYLVAIMDWASRKVLAWRLSNTMDADFCVAALEEAIGRHGKPGDDESPVSLDEQTSSDRPDWSERCHVWTAPSWQGLSSRFAALVGAAMCSACRCGSHDRWP
jgi:transposase InsO family protein